MSVRRRPGERREQLRFEVAGELWGNLGLSEPGVLRNLTPGGALIEARLPVEFRTTRSAQVLLDDGSEGLEVMVRHVTPLTEDPADERYLIGLEFVNVPPALRTDLDRLVREWSAMPTK
jgi:hypothetical protein